MKIKCRPNLMMISRDGQDGFAYLLSLSVLIAVGAASLYGQVAYREAKAKVVQQTETRRTLESIEEALIRYAAREKKLPCPADGTQSSPAYVQFPINPANGRCDFATTGNTADDGVVPWKELGLSSEHALDEWRRRISYRVFDAQFGPYPIATSLVNTATVSTNPLVIQGGVDLTECYKDGFGGGGSGVSASSYDHCIRLGRITNTVIDDTGFAVTGDTVMTPSSSTGAAFVLVSHGENGRGAFLSSGRRMPVSGLADEAANASGGPNFVARGPKTSDGAQPFDDLVLAVSVRKVAERAKLEPRKDCPDVYACYVLSLGPIAYWRLGETSGAASDSALIGARKHGTYNGAVTRGTAGALDPSIISDKSATFTTNATTVTVPHHADFSLSSGAISFWYRPNDTGSADMNLFQKGAFRIWIDKSWTYFAVGNGSNNWARRPAGSEFAWHHLVINWGPADLARGIPAGMKIYVDGVMNLESSNTPTLVGNTSTIQIAGEGNSNAYTGRVDEVVIYPRQLTSCEVRTLGDMDGSWPSSPPC